jgi:hypothetical protein
MAAGDTTVGSTPIPKDISQKPEKIGLSGGTFGVSSFYFLKRDLTTISRVTLISRDTDFALFQDRCPRLARELDILQPPLDHPAHVFRG